MSKVEIAKVSVDSKKRKKEGYLSFSQQDIERDPFYLLSVVTRYYVKIAIATLRVARKVYVQMMSILHFWSQGAHRKSLSTKKQAMMPEESVGYIELADAQLEAASGGYGQDCDQSYGHDQYGQDYNLSYRQNNSKGHHKHHHRHNQQQNYGSPYLSSLQSFNGHW